MLHESNAEPTNWQSRLNALSSMDSKPLDKQAAWQKLEDRLQEKQPRKQVAWYWMAAASVLVALTGFWLFKSDNKTNTMVPVVTVRAPQKLPAITTAVAPVKQEAIAATAAKPGKHTRSAHAIPTPTIYNDSSGNRVSLAPAEVVVNPGLRIDTMPRQIAKASHIRKYRVIQINELSKPAVETITAANQGSFWSPRPNAKAYNNAPAQSSADHFIIKIRLSPQN